MVNRYATFVRDIEPLGFDMITINGFLTETAVRQVADVIDHPDKGRDITDRNYRIARSHFSYEILQERLNHALSEIMGDRFRRMTAGGQPSLKYQLHPVDAPGKSPRADICWAQGYN